MTLEHTTDARMTGVQMGWMALAPFSAGMRHDAVVINCSRKEPSMQVTTIGHDLAKNVFQVHGISSDGDVAFNRALRRSQVLSFFERL